MPCAPRPLDYGDRHHDAGRRQVWGATFQTADKNKNLVGDIPNEFDRLLERLSEETLDRLQDEPTPQHRVQLFGFAAQMARLKPQIHDFLNQIFEPTRYHVNASLRGFYFTSGTQQGTPIDQLIGSLARTFGAEEVSAAAYHGSGKSFFLTNLITKVIIGESDWVSTDRGAVRRALIIKLRPGDNSEILAHCFRNAGHCPESSPLHDGEALGQRGRIPPVGRRANKERT